jgi:Tfp pilus assembly protein PilO
LSNIIDVVSGDIITKKGIDKKLPFIIYIFFLIILYIIWGLMVEDKMTVIRDNEKEIETLKIEYYQKELTLTGLNQKSKVETLLLQNGVTDLKAPEDPPMRILVKDAQ